MWQGRLPAGEQTWKKELSTQNTRKISFGRKTTSTELKKKKTHK